jgi:Cu/Ag efflux protein CusF
MKRPILFSLTAAVAALLVVGCERSSTDAGGGAADGGMRAPPGMQQQQAGQRSAEHTAEGTLNSVDRAAGTVNISHGPVASASWPAMTMSFKLADPSVATNLEAGQKVGFHFTIEGGMSATVTQITPVE